SLVDFHPLAVARRLLTPADFTIFARQTLAAMKFQPQAGPALPEALAWFRQRQWQTCRAVVEQAGLDCDELLAPPQPEGGDCRTYCPVCRNQYVVDHGVCQACGGVELVRL